MKKILLLCAITLSAATMVNAQSAGDGVKFGVRAAWDYSVPATDLTGLDSGSGVSAGILADIPIYKGLFFEPGVSYFYDTMDLDLLDLYFDNHKVGINGTLRNTGLRAPLLFGYRFDLVEDIAVSVITGPQINYGFSNKIHYANTGSKDINLYDEGWHRWDVGWTFGLKMHYQDNFFAEITGTVGISNILNADNYPGLHVRRNMVNVGVGYAF